MIRKIDFQPTQGRRPNTTQSVRAKWVQRLRRSGLSQQAFAGQHGLSVSTLYSWIKQTEQAATAKAPVPLREVPLSTMLSPWAAEVTRPDGVTIKLSAQTARELLPIVLDSGAC